MDKKKNPKVLRGWLPNEPAYTNHFVTQTSRQPKIRSYFAYTTVFVGVFAAVFLTMSIAYGAGFFAAANAGAMATIIVSIMVIKPNQKPNQNKPLTEEGKKAAKTIGIANFVMVGVFLGTFFLINPNIPSIEVTLGLWIILLFACFLVNNLLYRNFKKQTGFMEVVK